LESSLGWRLDILSLSAVQYAEAGRSIKLEVEDRPRVTGELEWIIYAPDNWVWKSADGEEPVATEKIPEILNRIRLAFWKLDMPIKEIV
ncbi:MAG TPA: hypothetical protein VKO67_01770, partial [Smithellaceae bacterium]|nr:hypothetical protein [Smithellaceae bacterium]